MSRTQITLTSSVIGPYTFLFCALYTLNNSSCILTHIVICTHTWTILTHKKYITPTCRHQSRHPHESMFCAALWTPLTLHLHTFCASQINHTAIITNTSGECTKINRFVWGGKASLRRGETPRTPPVAWITPAVLPVCMFYWNQHSLIIVHCIDQSHQLSWEVQCYCPLHVNKAHETYFPLGGGRPPAPPLITQHAVCVHCVMIHMFLII